MRRKLDLATLMIMTFCFMVLQSAAALQPIYDKYQRKRARRKRKKK